MRQITERDCAAVEEDGWRQFYNTKRNMSIIVRPDMPRLTGSTCAALYRRGFAAGRGPVFVVRDFSPVDTLYLDMDFGISTNWFGHGAINKAFFIQKASAGLIVGFKSKGTGAASFDIRSGTPLNIWTARSNTLIRGKAHRIEIRIINSAQGASCAMDRSGSVAAWIDGVRVINVSGVPFRCGQFQQIKWSPTYGGMGGPTVPADQYQYLGYFYASGH